MSNADLPLITAFDPCRTSVKIVSNALSIESVSMNVPATIATPSTIAIAVSAVRSFRPSSPLRAKRTIGRSGFSLDHTHCHDGAGEALQLQLGHRLGRVLRLDGRVRPLADQDLAGGGDVAKPLGEDHGVPDRSVLVAALEADPSERGVARGDADSEPEVVAAPTPVLREAREPVAQGERRPHGR